MMELLVSKGLHSCMESESDDLGFESDGFGGMDPSVKVRVRAIAGNVFK